MSETNPTYCITCSAKTQGLFCHNCGQKNTGKKLKLLSIIEDFLSNLFSLEKSGFATIFFLLTNPLKIVRSYWDGYRRYYEPPSKLIVYATIVIGFHIYYHDNLIFGLHFTDDPKSIFLLFFLFLLTISSYCTYFKRGHTLLEHLVANIYLFCSWAITLIILYEAIVYLIGENIELSLISVFALILLILMNTSRIFRNERSWQNMILTALLQ